MCQAENLRHWSSWRRSRVSLAGTDLVREDDGRENGKWRRMWQRWRNGWLVGPERWETRKRPLVFTWLTNVETELERPRWRWCCGRCRGRGDRIVQAVRSRIQRNVGGWMRWFLEPVDVLDAGVQRLGGGRFRTGSVPATAEQFRVFREEDRIVLDVLAE